MVIISYIYSQIFYLEFFFQIDGIYIVYITKVWSDVIVGTLMNRSWFNCSRYQGAEVDSDWPNGHSGNCEEAEESGEGGYHISWTCQGREEGREERRKEGGEEGREKGGQEGGKEGRQEVKSILISSVLSNSSPFFLLFCIFIYVEKPL